MKKVLFVITVFLISFSSCNDDSSSPSYEEQLAIDIEKIQDYLLEKNLTAQSTEDGLHYIIDVEGTGSTPTIDSVVKVKYVGKLLNDTIFDQGTTELRLNSYILGWQKGIPYFKEGGSGKLLIPSSMGYGVYAHYPIPANSVLVFDISLLSVRD